MAKTQSCFECSECGHQSPRWFGKCPECSSWSTAGHAPTGEGESGAVPLSAAGSSSPRLESDRGEIDRVLGGGLVPGQVVLVAGEPGVGKSTLALQFLAAIADCGSKPLLLSGEESLHQVHLRAARLELDTSRLRAAALTSIQAITRVCEAEGPDVMVVDSVQTLVDEELEQAAGSLVQVRECAARMARLAKRTGIATVLTGHVTKDGSVAGPKTLEHVVDSVLALEGERSGSVRLLRVLKNRFGSCEELGVFTMTPRGLDPVADPSSMLLSDRIPGIAGTIVFPSLEGARPVLVEVQALVTATNHQPTRRSAIGVDPGRLSLLLAVMSERAGFGFGAHDVFVAAAGGLAIREPASDLALCLALGSAGADVVIDHQTVAFGEVGLGGEVRRVPGIERRLNEAERLGFRNAIVPKSVPATRYKLNVKRVANVDEALAFVRHARAVSAA